MATIDCRAKCSECFISSGLPIPKPDGVKVSVGDEVDYSFWHGKNGILIGA
jgi:hypothetical protein